MKEYGFLKTKKGYMVYFQWEENFLSVKALKLDSKKVVYRVKIPTDDVVDFIRFIPYIFINKCKLMLFNIYGFTPSNFESNAKFIDYVKDFVCDEYANIHFITEKELLCSIMMINKNIKIKVGEKITLLIIEDERFVINEYEYTEYGYAFVKTPTIYSDTRHCLEMSKILEKFATSKFFVFYSSNPDHRLIQRWECAIEEKKFKVVKMDTFRHFDYCCVELGKSIINGNYRKYKFITNSGIKYQIVIGSEKIDVNEKFPVQIRKSIDRGVDKITVKMHDVPTGEKTNKDYPLNDQCHRNKFYVLVDSENILQLNITPIIWNEMAQISRILKLQDFAYELPVIVLFNKFTVICARNNYSWEYNILQRWNGIFGKDASILIENDLIICGFEATKMENEKPFNTVTDMITLLTMSENDLSNYQLPAFRGVSPSNALTYYFSRFIEEHIRVIESETGTTQEQIIFWILLNCNAEQKLIAQHRLNKICQCIDRKCFFLARDFQYPYLFYK